MLDKPNIFVYLIISRFSVDAGFNMFKVIFNATQFAGASHADEICYLFKCAGTRRD